MRNNIPIYITYAEDDDSVPHPYLNIYGVQVQSAEMIDMLRYDIVDGIDLMTMVFFSGGHGWHILDWRIEDAFNHLGVNGSNPGTPLQNQTPYVEDFHYELNILADREDRFYWADVLEQCTVEPKKPYVEYIVISPPWDGDEHYPSRVEGKVDSWENKLYIFEANNVKALGVDCSWGDDVEGMLDVQEKLKIDYHASWVNTVTGLPFEDDTQTLHLAPLAQEPAYAIVLPDRKIFGDWEPGVGFDKRWDYGNDPYDQCLSLEMPDPVGNIIDIDLEVSFEPYNLTLEAPIEVSKNTLYQLNATAPGLQGFLYYIMRSPNQEEWEIPGTDPQQHLLIVPFNVDPDCKVVDSGYFDPAKTIEVTAPSDTGLYHHQFVVYVPGSTQWEISNLAIMEVVD